MAAGGSQDASGENGKVIQMQNELLRTIETLSHQRLNLIRQLSGQSAAALQCLDVEDVEGFAEYIKKRDTLIHRVDELTNKLSASLAHLETKKAAVLHALLTSGAEITVCPQWCAALASDREKMDKLLHNCIGMNVRMDALARALTGQLQKQLTHIHANKKVRSRYMIHDGSTAGMHINYTSK